MQITWLAIEADYFWMAAETEHCIEVAEQTLQIAAETGMHVWNIMLPAAAAWGAQTSDKLQLAMRHDDVEGMDEHGCAALRQ